MLKQAFILYKGGVAIALSLMLAGCATHWSGDGAVAESGAASGPVTTPVKSPDYSKMHKSTVTYQYVPVPVPGQLMAMPSFKDAGKEIQKSVTGLKAVTEANKKALQKPKSDQYFNSMLTYAYMPGAVYTIYAASGKITDIELQPGEKITNIATADSANWQVQTSPSGTGKNQITHILVKPMIIEAGDNTIIVLTNKRTYHLYFKVTDNGTFMMSVKWDYPNSDGSMFVSENKHKSATASDDDAIDPSSMTFNYQWEATSDGKPDWYPTQIFHNGTKTYIRFPKDFSHQMNLPILYIPDGNGGYSTMSNWRLLNKNTMVVDGVLKTARLETGSVKGKRSTVEIRMVLHGKS